MDKAIAKFSNYFQEKGLVASDIPKAIVVHELLGIVMALTAWSVCYALHPSQTLLRPAVAGVAKGQASARLQRAYTAAMVQAQATVRRMSWLQKAPAAVDPGRLTVSLAESLCFRAAAKPATFAFKLWASWKLVLLMKGGQRQSQPLVLASPAAGKQPQ